MVKMGIAEARKNSVMRLANADQLVRRPRKVRQVQPPRRLEPERPGRPAVVPIEVLDEPVGRIAVLADVHDVGVRIVLRTPGH
jgi:hypothetical protein